MPKHDSTSSLEQEILRLKSELARTTRDRNLALRAGHTDEGLRHHLAALETQVKQLATLAKYVQVASPPAGRELASRQALLWQHFQRFRAGGDPAELRRWVTQELAPLVNKSEQAAHLVASLSHRAANEAAKPFVWRPARRR